MRAMSKQERVRAALAGEPVDRIPVSMWGHDFLRESAPEDLVAATLESYRAYDWDFIKLNPRATLFAEAWGSVFQPPSEQRLAATVSRPIERLEDLAAVRPIDPRAGVFGEHLTALRLLLDQVGDEVDVVQTLFSPLSVVAMLCGPPERFLGYAAADPALAHAAVAAVTETLSGYAAACLEAGASGVFFAPLTWVSRDTCDEAFYREYGRPYDLQILGRIRTAAFNTLHVCRDHIMIDLVLDYPVHALNEADQGPGNPRLAEVKQRTDEAVMGGIDQTRLETMPAADVAVVGARGRPGSPADHARLLDSAGHARGESGGALRCAARAVLAGQLPAIVYPRPCPAAVVRRPRDEGGVARGGCCAGRAGGAARR